MDKQLNARVNPELHNQIKKLSTDSKIIMNTLVETLLEIGLKHYLEGSLSTDSSSYITKDDLTPIEDRLKKLESLIANSPSGQASSESDRLKALERYIASLDRKLDLQEQRLIKPSPVKNISTASSRRGKEITFNTASDGSIVLRSIKGTDLRTFKKLTDAQLNEMGIRKVEIGGGIKFYPID